MKLQQIQNKSLVATGDFYPCDEGWATVNHAEGVKTVYLRSVWEPSRPTYRPCSIRVEDTSAVRILQVGDIKVALPKDILIHWMGDGLVKFQQEVR